MQYHVQTNNFVVPVVNAYTLVSCVTVNQIVRIVVMKIHLNANQKVSLKTFFFVDCSVALNMWCFFVVVATNLCSFISSACKKFAFHKKIDCKTRTWRKTSVKIVNKIWIEKKNFNKNTHSMTFYFSFYHKFWTKQMWFSILVCNDCFMHSKIDLFLMRPNSNWKMNEKYPPSSN